MVSCPGRDRAVPTSGGSPRPPRTASCPASYLGGHHPEITPWNPGQPGIPGQPSDRVIPAVLVPAPLPGVGSWARGSQARTDSSLGLGTQGASWWRRVCGHRALLSTWRPSSRVLRGSEAAGDAPVSVPAGKDAESRGECCWLGAQGRGDTGAQTESPQVPGPGVQMGRGWET